MKSVAFVIASLFTITAFAATPAASAPAKDAKPAASASAKPAAAASAPAKK